LLFTTVTKRIFMRTEDEMLERDGRADSRFKTLPTPWRFKYYTQH
jgi:hypothetical protein